MAGKEIWIYCQHEEGWEAGRLDKIFGTSDRITGI